jgi:hypothetical protein
MIHMYRIAHCTRNLAIQTEVRLNTRCTTPVVHDDDTNKGLFLEFAWDITMHKKTAWIIRQINMEQISIQVTRSMSQSSVHYI